MSQNKNKNRKKKFAKIILAYPIALILIGLSTNILLFGVKPAVIALPAHALVVALALSSILLLVNHTWLMTSTELTRLKYNMHATPEEWAASEHSQANVSDEGVSELERRHHAHGNATENTVYFVFLALLISVVTPVTIAALVWIFGFAIGRLGHMFSYLSGRDGLRGIFMSVSLLSLYGMASYVAVSLII